MTTPILGIDIGDTIIRKDGSSFMENHLENEPFPDLFPGLEYLYCLFGGKIFLISACTEDTERKTVEWLEHHHFSDRTGIPRDNMHFCRERRHKHPICKELGITHFIDNRIGVLRSLKSVPNRYCFNPDAFPEKDYSDVHVLHSWSDVTVVFPSL